MTALDDLRRALSTVERWRDEATPLPWARAPWDDGTLLGKAWIDWDGGDGSKPTTPFGVVQATRSNGDLILAAITVLLDEGSGVAAILQDAEFAYRTGDGAKYDFSDALRLAELVNGIEATR